MSIQTFSLNEKKVNKTHHIEAGMQFGYLTAIERAADYIQPNGFTKAQWRCRCVCGRYVIKQQTSLLWGQVKSCGCKKSAMLKGNADKVFQKGDIVVYNVTKTQLSEPCRVVSKAAKGGYNLKGVRTNKYHSNISVKTLRLISRNI